MNLVSNKIGPRLICEPRTANKVLDVLFHATGECALGKVLVARSIKGVCAILLGDDQSMLEADLAQRFPKARFVANEAMVRGDLVKIARYVDNPAEGLNLALDMRGTPLQRRIWELIRAIPVGTTMSYTHLARLLNCAHPSASARAIGNACAANRLALAVPCHRVIRTDGGLADYRWGLMRKCELLKREAAA